MQIFVTACPKGTYRAQGPTCQPCPENTIQDAVAAPECQCLDGYFRDNEPEPIEGPEFGCTGR